MRGVNCFILVVHVRSSFDAFTALSAIRSAELRSLDDRKQRIVGDHSCVLEDRHDRIYIYIYSSARENLLAVLDEATPTHCSNQSTVHSITSRCKQFPNCVAQLPLRYLLSAKAKTSTFENP